jgi:hypothetical protein
LGVFVGVKGREGGGRSFGGAARSKDKGTVTSEAMITQTLVMTVFAHVAKGRCSLYNRMRGLNGKLSKLFPEALYLVKDLRGFLKEMSIPVFG